MLIRELLGTRGAKLVIAMVAALLISLTLGSALGSPDAFAVSHGPRVLSGSVPAPVKDGRARLLGRAAPGTTVHLAVGLRMRDRGKLDGLLAGASDPDSPNYGHYATQAQANAAFNPTAADEGRVAGWLRSHGLKVTRTYPNHLLVDARGTVAQVSDTFHVTINDYQTTVRGKQVKFYANANNPTVDASVSDTVQAVLGLNNYPLFHKEYTNGSRDGYPPYLPQDFADAYNVNPLWNSSYTGAGQHIAITLWTLPPSDTSLSQFHSDTGANVANRTNGRLRVIPVDGGSTNNQDGEAAMDIEYSSGMAPGATIDYYEGSAATAAAMADALNAAGTATDANGNPLDRQISNSWGGAESSSGVSTIDNILASNSATGHNYFFSSGDNGSWALATQCSGDDPWPDYPTSSRYVTSVGGTRFNADVNGAYPGENTWLYDPAGNYNSCTGGSAPEGSGGGYSRISSRPSWQTGTGLAANGMRGYPDVAADADPDTGAYVVGDYDGAGQVGGTSLASPLWAGMVAVMNQYLHANGKPYAGFMDPKLYSIANHTQTYAPYHDVTSGTNGSYDAGSGWDAVTGWGSPNLYNLARDWAGAADTTAPDTTITSGPSGTVNTASASFGFSSTEAGSTFECSLDGAAFSSCSSPKSYTNLANGSHTFRVRAKDAAGNVDPTPASRAWTVNVSQLQTFQENNRDHTQYGGWFFYKNSNFSGGYSSSANARGSTAVFTFSGTSVIWKTQKLPDAGITAVYLDGAKVRSFDGYSASPQYNVTGFSKAGLANRRHTLKLVVTGTRNASSSNHYTDIDRFAVGSTSFQESSPNISYDGWAGAKNANASGGFYRYGISTTRPSFFFDFTGPQVNLYTATGPGQGHATVKVVDTATRTVAKTLTYNLASSATHWKVKRSITGLDPSKSYYLYVLSSDGKPVIVDAYQATLPLSAAPQTAGDRSGRGQPPVLEPVK